MTAELWVALAVAIAGATTGLVALLKLRGDSALTTVTIAERAVLLQGGVLDSMQQQQADMSVRLRAIEDLSAEASRRAEEAERRAVAAEQQRDQLLRANADLQERLGHLEAEVRRLGGSL